MRRRRLLAPLLALAAVAACGGDDATDVGEERAEQVRTAAIDAGLSEPIADALALAAQADSATFQVEYPGTEGARIILSQSPPDRRVDVVQGDLVIESRVLRDGVAYRCVAGAEGEDDTDLTCTRAAGALDAPGTFTLQALEDFAEAIAATKETVTVSIQRRNLAGVSATCIVSTPKAGTTLDGTDPGTSELCLSPEGAQLLVDQGQERLVADEYRTEVPEGTYDVEGD